MSDKPDISEIATALARWIAAAAGRELPDDVESKARQHLLDTAAAMMSGSQLKAGRLAADYVSRFAGAPKARIAGTGLRGSAIDAAFANAMSAHADETDDSHLAGRFHPGCAIVPAALAVAEAEDRSGTKLLRAIVLGYDIGARATLALGYARPDTARHSTHSLGAAFGAAAAAAALFRLDERQCRHALSYAVQQASGVPYWQRDREHVEKAFDFGGMGARNGVTAAAMVASGFSAVEDPFSGRHNYLTAFAEQARPEALTDSLGERFEILRASIKKWCVGSPIQAALDSAYALRTAHRFAPPEIAEIRIHIPDNRLHIVDNRQMPDVCLQHLVAVLLLDGALGFRSAHDQARMSDPAVRALRSRIKAVPSAELTAAVPERQAIVEIDLTDGRRLSHRTHAVRGTPDNPMDPDEVDSKALDLIAPVAGLDRAQAILRMVRDIGAARARDLADLLALDGAHPSERGTSHHGR